jgi:hypothetical protein
MDHHHLASDDWIDGLLAPISRGQRIMITMLVARAASHQMHTPASSRTGVQTIIRDMSFINYEKWLEEKLIKNLLPHGAAVTSAPYHNVQMNLTPTSNSWNSVNNIMVKREVCKPDLYQLIMINNPVHGISKLNVWAEHTHTIFAYYCNIQNSTQMT